MPNPFLIRVGYVPAEEPFPLDGDSGGGIPPGPPRGAPSPPPPSPHPRRRIVLPPSVWKGVSAVFLLAVGGLLGRTWTQIESGVKAELTRVITRSPEVPSGEMISLVVERYGTVDEAIEANPPGWKRLVEAWNTSGPNRFDISAGGVSGTSNVVYAPRSRLDHEDEFGGMLRHGLDDVDLYVINVPASWAPDYLEDQIYKWAAWCRVRHEWIPIWSAFRPHRLARPRSECRPGGRCMIVSDQCDHKIHNAIGHGGSS